jgi:hypothetical protein
LCQTRNGDFFDHFLRNFGLRCFLSFLKHLHLVGESVPVDAFDEVRRVDPVVVVDLLWVLLDVLLALLLPLLQIGVLEQGRFELHDCGSDDIGFSLDVVVHVALEVGMPLVKDEELEHGHCRWVQVLAAVLQELLELTLGFGGDDQVCTDEHLEENDADAEAIMDKLGPLTHPDNKRQRIDVWRADRGWISLDGANRGDVQDIPEVQLRSIFVDEDGTWLDGV